MGAVLLGWAAYEWVLCRARSASAWKVVLIAVGGLGLLLRDTGEGSGNLIRAVFDVVICLFVAVWIAKRVVAGVNPHRIKVLGIAAALLLLVDVAAAGGPGIWWQTTSAELVRVFGGGRAND